MAITSDRDIFLGIHVTQDTKDALKFEAERRKMSVSALSSTILDKWLLTASSEEVGEVRSNKRTPKGNPNEIDVPLNFEE